MKRNIRPLAHAVRVVLGCLATAPLAWGETPTIQDARPFMQDGKYEEAAAVYERIVTTDSENAQAWYLLGYARHSHGDYAAAVSAYEKAESLSFNPPGTPYNLACALARIGRTEEALDHLAKAASRGFNQYDGMKTDEDLASLRDEPRFQEVLSVVEKNAKPCDDAPFRRFDFWIGEWDVFQNGQLAGTNEIERISGGCALFESWVNATGTTGHSINYYDPKQEIWKQTWVGGGGSITEYREVPRDTYVGDMCFLAPYTAQDGREGEIRMAFHANEDGTVRQHIQTTFDGGETWNEWFDGQYVRKDQATAEPAGR